MSTNAKGEWIETTTASTASAAGTVFPGGASEPWRFGEWQETPRFLFTKVNLLGVEFTAAHMKALRAIASVVAWLFRIK
jgi:hypothetical protein